MIRATAKRVDDPVWLAWLAQQEQGMARRQVTTEEARERMRVSARLRRKVGGQHAH